MPLSSPPFPLADQDPTPSAPCAVQHELRHVRALMQLEQKEDQAQFKLNNASATIKERRRRGLTWYPVTITQEDIGFGGKVVLELERPAHRQDLHLFQVGKNASLFSDAPGNSGPDRQVLSGVVTSVRRNKLLLATTKEALPDWALDGSTLGIDLTFDEVSYREMNQALSAVMLAHGNRLAELRDVLLGARPASFREHKADDFFFPSALNDSQLAAVRHVVSAQDVAIIHGPPGTGKTTTLVQAILETIRRERRVLVSASSNTAVDLLTEKLAERGVNVIRLGNPSRVSDLLLQHTLDAGVMAHASYSKMHAMRQTAEQHRDTANEHVRHFGFEERQHRQWLREEARTLRQAADDLERFMIEDVLESVQVITCTLVGASNRHIRHLIFETVFIDEAAQALEPGCWIPIAKGQRIVLAGDHHQLPPTVKSEKAAREGLRETLFEKCIQRQPQTARMLTVQYRMHEHIMGFSSEKFYGSQLVPHFSVRHAGLAAYDPRFAPDLPMEFIDTAGCGFLEMAIPESRSTANPKEAHLLLQRLAQLLEPYDSTEPQQAPLTIGVIAPYRAQINYLKDAIEDSAALNDLLLQRRLSVGTVDSFQGQERDIIAISLTRSNTQGEIGFLSDIRRMNVGMTRARRKLLLVGDSSTLCCHPFFVDLLAYVKRIGGYSKIAG
ncbi:AAA domain-containing protein [Actimicrobium sp. CCI2.3]|uniref:AAA domain-containing protein n=2 Tax=Actimicrobium sp. CCI2.3 TaxID=3048616 RepID=UPI002B242E59|nr:AAA domain-containing protein [Actimicrobium sp. CCI2.3]MEB0022358.1 AAA domain-containing protein [Actimicrobium sp. CCI2.3]